jgi:hypothetical protein
MSETSDATDGSHSPLKCRMSHTASTPSGFPTAGCSTPACLDEGARPRERQAEGTLDPLDSHASGQRSGDKFCIYVCDRFIIPTLSADDLRAVGDGALLLDALTKRYIREFLSYRFVTTPDSSSAFRVERLVQAGALDAGKPVLNPR